MFKYFSFLQTPHFNSLLLGEDFGYHQSDTHWIGCTSSDFSLPRVPTKALAGGERT